MTFDAECHEICFVGWKTNVMILISWDLENVMRFILSGTGARWNKYWNIRKELGVGWGNELMLTHGSPRNVEVIFQVYFSNSNRELISWANEYWYLEHLWNCSYVSATEPHSRQVQSTVDRGMAITWTSVDQAFRCHMAPLGHDELKRANNFQNDDTWCHRKHNFWISNHEIKYNCKHFKVIKVVSVTVTRYRYAKPFYSVWPLPFSSHIKCVFCPVQARYDDVYWGESEPCVDDANRDKCIVYHNAPLNSNWDYLTTVDKITSFCRGKHDVSLLDWIDT